MSYIIIIIIIIIIISIIIIIIIINLVYFDNRQFHEPNNYGPTLYERSKLVFQSAPHRRTVIMGPGQFGGGEGRFARIPDSVHISVARAPY